MSRPVKLRRQARKEFDEAVDWYERQRAGLGVQFRRTVQEVLDRVGATPEVHGVVYEDIRCALVNRFPYGVYYRVKPNRVTVIAVFHSSRDPRQWQSRARGV